ncbi:hypothetical protein [Paraburkholderia aromaticivorans]|uniref:hypothetical protein n=1 Tax=Paraburkholderia aromaticivorans TaxID=2026199 RepID=UPI001456145F|nr:hypothetical protein [Paraburkholderia aromaticivorans]
MENVLDKARKAGMAVLLDACIGHERFHSVVGSEATLERFARLCETPVADHETLRQWAELCECGAGAAVAAAIRSAIGSRIPGNTSTRGKQ